MKVTQITAEQATAANLRCAACGKGALGVPFKILFQPGVAMRQVHDGPCPTASGWGKAAA